MNTFPVGSQLTSRIEQGYNGLLACYPATFREQYTEEMAEIFTQNWSKSEGTGDRVRYIIHVLWDWVWSMATEWSAALSWGWWLTLALLGINLSLNFFAGRYYSVAMWALVCFQTSLGSILLSRFTGRNKVRLILQILVIGVLGFFAPHCFHTLAHRETSKNDWEQVIFCVSMLCTSIVQVSLWRPSTALGNETPDRMPKPTVSPLIRWSLPILILTALIAGACYFGDLGALTHCNTAVLAVLSSLLVGILRHVYYVPEASATYSKESQMSLT